MSYFSKNEEENDFLRRRPVDILDIGNPTDEQMRVAFYKMLELLRYYDNVSDDVIDYLCVEKPYEMLKNHQHRLNASQKHLCVCNHPVSIRFIDEPNDELQFIAIEGSANAIQYINNVDDDLRYESIRIWPDSILNMKNRDITRDMIVLALDKLWDKFFLERLMKKLNVGYVEKDHWFRRELKKLKVKNGTLGGSLRNQHKYRS